PSVLEAFQEWYVLGSRVGGAGPTFMRVSRARESESEESLDRKKSLLDRRILLTYSRDTLPKISPPFCWRHANVRGMPVETTFPSPERTPSREPARITLGRSASVEC